MKYPHFAVWMAMSVGYTLGKYRGDNQLLHTAFWQDIVSLVAIAGVWAWLELRARRAKREP